MVEPLAKEFADYMIHGGFLTAANDLAKEHCILPATLRTHADWIRGDLLKRGKQESHLKEILRGIWKRYGSQITWNDLLKDVTVEHTKTISDYLEILSTMEVLYILPALAEHRIASAPKKARKVLFMDPFISHVIQQYLFPSEKPYEDHILPLIQDSEAVSPLVEACVVGHYLRKYPVYYIKAEGEVDLAYIDKNRFWPIEVKWTRQLRAKDLKQIQKYRHGLILNRFPDPPSIQGVPVHFLPFHLFQLQVL